MPFKKIGPNKYKSESGKTYTKKQVEAYYATDGFKKPVKKKPKRSQRTKTSKKKNKR